METRQFVLKGLPGVRTLPGPAAGRASRSGGREVGAGFDPRARRLRGGARRQGRRGARLARGREAQRRLPRDRRLRAGMGGVFTGGRGSCRHRRGKREVALSGVPAPRRRGIMRNINRLENWIAQL